MRSLVTLLVGCVASAVGVAQGGAQEEPATLYTVISGEGYSHGAALRVHQAGSFLGAAVEWSGDSPIINKFVLPRSTYEVDLAGKALTLDLNAAQDEQILEIRFVTAASGRYTVSVEILDQSFQEWIDKSKIDAIAGATFKLEELDDELVIQVEPTHPLVGLERLSPDEREEVLASLRELRSVPPEPYTLRVKDMQTTAETAISAYGREPWTTRVGATMR